MKKALIFSMKNCGPCKVYAPVLQEVKDQGYDVVKYMIEDEPSLASQYKLRSAPTTVILENGEEVDRFSGPKSASQLIEILEG